MVEDSRAFSFRKGGLLCQPQFLLAWQALELMFCSQCLSFAVESPGSHERDRSMGSGVTCPLSCIVQSNASLDIDGVASVERPISAADHVDVVCLPIRYLIHPSRPFSFARCPADLSWSPCTDEDRGRGSPGFSLAPWRHTTEQVFRRHLCAVSAPLSLYQAAPHRSP